MPMTIVSCSRTSSSISSRLWRDAGVVEGDGDAGDFLDRGDELGEEVEHVLGRDAHRLRAVDVERDVVRAEVRLELGELLIPGDVARFPRAGGAGEGVVDQLAD